MLLRAGFFIGFVALSLGVFADPPTNAVVIPLKDIWALDMPGTKHLRELDGQSIDQIAAALPYLPANQSVKPRSGFVVKGNGKQALAEAINFLRHHQQPNSFKPDDDVTLVFFSHLCGQYINIRKIEQKNFTITVSYEFIPHDSKNISAQFALIPLGSLTAGKYDVEYTPLPLGAQYQGYTSLDPEYIVCKSFSFTVGGQP